MSLTTHPATSVGPLVQPEVGPVRHQPLQLLEFSPAIASGTELPYAHSKTQLSQAIENLIVDAHLLGEWRRSLDHRGNGIGSSTEGLFHLFAGKIPRQKYAMFLRSGSFIVLSSQLVQSAQSSERTSKSSRQPYPVTKFRWCDIPLEQLEPPHFFLCRAC
jgi:hypothetical protein